MRNLKNILLVLGALLLVNVALFGINILQNGSGSWSGKSMDEILGVPAQQATVADIERLSKSEVMQLFLAAEAPDLQAMKGEYRAKTLSVGIMAGAADFFTHHFFGPGRWQGKAFHPLDQQKGKGYNIFTDGRKRKMDTYIATSAFDEKDSMHLDYSPYNTGLVHSMHDEIRKINDSLFLGMGHMAAGGGAINPAPFVLYGQPSPWVGPDE